jgi:thiosulfate/3-mercaptopyruvate sulfurtransferase
MLHATFLTIALLSAAEDKAARYALPELLLEPADLARPETAKKYVILDARGADAYRAGHVPGAVRVDPRAWAKAFAAGQDRADWTARIGELGINGKKPVVIYDAVKNKDAARIWWILRYWGLEDVRLLNGSWAGWLAAGGTKETAESTPVRSSPILKARTDRLATKGDLLEGLKKGSTGQILDTRSEGEYCGTEKTAKRNGTMPGSKHLEWSDTLDAKTGRFKSAPELAKLFQEAGIDPSKPATTYCQSGGRASVMAFALELMGGKPARNYYRSWAEWGNAAETPIVTPRRK